MADLFFDPYPASIAVQPSKAIGCGITQALDGGNGHCATIFTERPSLKATAKHGHLENESE